MVNQDLGRVCVVLRGEYDPTASYERLDCVSYQGSSYLVRKHCIGVPPAEGEYYQIAAKAGADGAPGADGSDASVTAENIKTALGYTPGKMVYNLLDNSDFLNPVNQRGQSSYKNAAYTIDRWRFWDSAAELSVNSNGITTTGILWQYLEPKAFRSDKKHTIAVMTSDGALEVHAGLFSSHLGGLMCWCDIEEDGKLHVCLNSGYTYIWAALYEGEYTAETLPEYQPKGYGAELAECQRYYINLNPNNINYDTVAFGMGWDVQNEVDFVVNLPVPMRKTPSFTNQNNLRIYDATTASFEELPSSTVILLNQHGLKIVCSGVNGWVQGRMYTLNTLADNVSIGLTADL